MKFIKRNRYRKEERLWFSLTKEEGGVRSIPQGSEILIPLYRDGKNEIVLKKVYRTADGRKQKADVGVQACLHLLCTMLKNEVVRDRIESEWGFKAKITESYHEDGFEIKHRHAFIKRFDRKKGRYIVWFQATNMKAERMENFFVPVQWFLEDKRIEGLDPLIQGILKDKILRHRNKMRFLLD
jgi:hypothetical protein